MEYLANVWQVLYWFLVCVGAGVALLLVIALLGALIMWIFD